MSISSINASLSGIQAAQAQHAAAATAIAGGGDIVDGVLNGQTAEVSMAVNISMLRQAMDQEKYLIDVLVQ